VVIGRDATAGNATDGAVVALGPGDATGGTLLLAA
jgi:hypothetical protein